MKDSFKRYLAEFVGTFILAVIGVGAAVGGAGYAGTALAFGAAIIIMAYSFGRISGGHVNPARSLSAAVFAAFGNGAGTHVDSLAGLKEILVFILAPVIGAALAALCWKVFHAKKEEVKEDSSVK